MNKAIEIYEKHIGSNAQMQYKSTPMEDVLDAMKEIASIAFDAGYVCCSTAVRPLNIGKEEYISNLFDNEVDKSI